MTKSQQYFQDMLEYNNNDFQSFTKIHDAYEKNPKDLQEKFNEEGEKILSIIRRYEDMLCSTSETSGYGKFSSNLSEKFWELIRRKFPKIDAIGIKP